MRQSFLPALKNKCIQLGVEQVGIHACRRTINSKLRCSGVPSTVAATLLGHKEQVNEQYYTFDITSLKEKTKVVEMVNAQTIKSCSWVQTYVRQLFEKHRF